MTTEAPLKLFMVAGEPSGDLHAANLAREIQRLAPGSEIHGLGGPQMRAAGVTVHFDLVDLAIMWFRRVTASLHIIRQALRDALDWVDANQPDAVILVDYPGFNLALARFQYSSEDMMSDRIAVGPDCLATPPQYAWSAGDAALPSRRLNASLTRTLYFSGEYQMESEIALLASPLFKRVVQ